MEESIKILNFQGQAVGHAPFKVESSGRGQALLLQYLRTYAFGQRKGQAAVKNRGQVAGGGRKPWRQKGTGRARQGSIRSPLWRGGGVAHGPKPRRFHLKMNQRTKPLVWGLVLGLKMESAGRFLALKADREEIRTKEAHSVISESLNLKGPTFMVSSSERIRRAFRNLRNVHVSSLSGLKPYQVLRSQNFILVESSTAKISEDLKLLRSRIRPKVL